MIEIVEARFAHVGPVASRASDRVQGAYAQIGVSPRRGVRKLLALSDYRRCAIVDGRPMVLWGVTGQFMDTEGHVWMSLAEDARKLVGFEMARRAVWEVRQMLAFKHRLLTTVLCQDDRAIRFARWLGFEISENPEEVYGLSYYPGELKR